MLDVELECGTPDRCAVDPAVVDPQVLGHDRGIVDVVGEAGAGAHISVDVGLREARIRQRPAQSLGMVVHGVELRCDRVVTPPDADDDRITRSHGISLPRTPAS